MLKKLVIVMVGGFLGISGALATTDHAPPAAPAQPPGVMANGGLVHPCNGEKSSVAEQRRQATFDIYRPHHPLANDENLSQVWDCPGPQFALEYQTGVSIYVGRNTLENPEQVWATMAAKYPEFSVDTVRGEVASLADPDASTNGTALGGVDLVVGGVRLTVSGDGTIKLAKLQEVMESLRRDG